MSLNDLAANVGISNVNLSKLKTGKVSAIRFSTLDGICRLLVNCVRLKLADEGYLADVEDIAEAFGIPVCGVIPYDENMHVAFTNGCPVADLEDSEAGAHLSRVFHRLV